MANNKGSRKRMPETPQAKSAGSRDPPEEFIINKHPLKMGPEFKYRRYLNIKDPEGRPKTTIDPAAIRRAIEALGRDENEKRPIRAEGLTKFQKPLRFGELVDKPKPDPYRIGELADKPKQDPYRIGELADKPKQDPLRFGELADRPSKPKQAPFNIITKPLGLEKRIIRKLDNPRQK
ncbi:MAG: hypothetical protein V1644_02120 [Candidatus Micrarchaeota archaeon]